MKQHFFKKTINNRILSSDRTRQKNIQWKHTKRVHQWNHLVFADKYNLEGKVLSLPFMTDDAILFVCFTVPVFAEAFWITGFGITIPFLFLMMSFHWFPEHPLFAPRGIYLFLRNASGAFFYKSDSCTDFSPFKNTPRSFHRNGGRGGGEWGGGGSLYILNVRRPYLFWWIEGNASELSKSTFMSHISDRWEKWDLNNSDIYLRGDFEWWIFSPTLSVTWRNDSNSDLKTF